MTICTDQFEREQSQHGKKKMTTQVFLVFCNSKQNLKCLKANTISLQG